MIYSTTNEAFEYDFMYHNMSPKERRAQIVEQNGVSAKHLRIPRQDLETEVKEIIQDYVDHYDVFNFKGWIGCFGMPKYTGPNVTMKVNEIEDTVEMYRTDGLSYIITPFTLILNSTYGSVRVGHLLKIYEDGTVEINHYGDEMLNDFEYYKTKPKFREFLKQAYLSIPKTHIRRPTKKGIKFGYLCSLDNIGSTGYRYLPTTFLSKLMTDPVTYIVTVGSFVSDETKSGWGAGDLLDLFNDLNEKYFDEWFDINYPSMFDKLGYHLKRLEDLIWD